MRQYLVIAALMFTSMLLPTGQVHGSPRDSELAETQAFPATLRIGAILPLSGEIAVMGSAVRNGIILAQEEIARRRAANPGLPTLEVRFEDDSFTPKSTVTAYKKLTSIDEVQGLIGFGSATGNSIATSADDAGVLFFSISSDPNVSRGKKGVFTVWVTPEAETAVLFDEAKKRGYKRIARICTIHDGAIAVRDYFDKANRGDFELVLDEEYAGDQKDFKPYLAKLKTKQGFDAFLPLLFPEQLGVFARQARDLGFEQPFFGYELFEDAKAVELSQGALIDAWYSSYGAPSEKFLSEYKTRFPGQVWLGAANGYDSVMMFWEAALKARGSSDWRSVAAAHVRGLKDFSGALGTYSSMGDNRFHLPAGLYVVKQTGFEPLGAPAQG